jgi:putative transposase
MPEYRRAKIEGGTYFFTVNTHQRQAILTEASIREALRDAIAAAKQSHPFKIDAWVLLPDHLHCI